MQQYSATNQQKSNGIDRVTLSTPISVNCTFSQENTGIRFFYTNATSLGNKLNELDSRLNFLEFPHVLMFSETWFSERSIVKVTNYKFFNQARPHISGGGVSIYVREYI